MLNSQKIMKKTQNFKEMVPKVRFLKLLLGLFSTFFNMNYLIIQK